MVQMTRIIAQWRASGETITEEDLARVSPLASAHVIPNGTYFVRTTPRASDEPTRPQGGEIALDS